MNGIRYTFADEAKPLVKRYQSLLAGQNDTAAVLLFHLSNDIIHQIKTITALDEYEYGGVPVINGRGFGLEIFSQADAERFITEYKNSIENDKGIYDKWLNFDLYRRVAVK